MASFHVFVEGPTDGQPGAVERLAQAIAKHYGLGAADLLTRLQKGRFRVKTNADRETADAYARDLQRLGARVTIEEATPANSQRTTPLPFPAARPQTPPAGLPAVKPAAPAAPSSGGQQFQSGLSAAFSGEMPAADLGALADGDSIMSLASLDGVDDGGAAPAAGAFTPPDAGGVSASIGPAPEKKAAVKKPAGDGKPDRPVDAPLDMFAPPEAQGGELKFDLADDEFATRKANAAAEEATAAAAAAATATTAPARASSQKLPVTPAPARKSQPSMQPANEPAGVVATSLPSKWGPLGDERVRFAAGIVLAILIGFLPAHFIAKMKEESANETVDRKVIAAQQAAETPELYANLDRMRADQLGRKEDEHRNAAIIGFAIWALVGGGIAFAWFKKIPWDA